MATENQHQIRMMHIVNLMSIAYADGEITQTENDALIDIANRLELTKDDFDGCIEYWKHTDENDIPIAVPETEDEQVEYLKDFTLVMMIDGEIEDNEKQYLFNVAEQFGFNAEEAVPALIDLVYQEHFDNDDSTSSPQEEEDPLFEDTYDESQISLGSMYLESKEIDKAFDELFLPALRNSEAFEYFVNIPGIDTRLYRLSEEQLAKVEEVADKGYALGHYVLGRYHQVVKPDEDSLQKAQQLLESAAQAGIPDAMWALAMQYLYGYHGPVVYNEYNDLIEQAIQNNSPMALKQRLHDMIHGEHGQQAAPKQVIKLIDNFLAQDENNKKKYPYMYDLLGDAYRKVGNKDKADECYEKAEDNGYFESGASRFLNKIEGPDKDFYRSTLSVLLDFACDNQDPNAFLTRGLENAFHYETEQKEEKKADWTQKIKDDLETAYKLGNGDAAYYLGLYAYEGSHGFDHDDNDAWAWFSKGQDMESGLAFAGTAMMIENGIRPADLPDNYLEYMQLSALRRGVKAMLPAVIKAYNDGKLDPVAEEVEKNYLPMLSQVTDQSGLPTIVIVTPEGKATVYKLEKAEWNKAVTLIGAKRLAPVTAEAIHALGKKAGLTDRLVAWIDIDAPRKGLPVNGIASKLINGVIAGDVVFTLADKLFEQVPFYGVDEATTVVKALGAELADVVTDLRTVKETPRTHADYAKVNPIVSQGYVARIEPDGTAFIVKSGLQVFALFEEDIYDPVRLNTLHDFGKKLGLKGRLTLWTDNSAIRKQLNWSDTITPNPVGAKWCPGPVADNLFVALEDDNYRIMLFDDTEQLKQVCLALGATAVKSVD